MSSIYQHIIEKNKEYLEIMPYYVVEYYRSASVSGKQPRTLNEYLKEYNRFFTWLITPQKDIYNNTIIYCDYPKIADIDIKELEHLPKAVVESYFAYLLEKNQVTLTTRARTYAALSSLFKFLTITSENDDGEPYFYRNVIAKVKLETKYNETLSSRASRIAPKLFLDDETNAFLNFIDNDFKNQLSGRAVKSFEFNKERDLAIIALLLASGIRLNECVNINYKDINLTTLSVNVIRKGGRSDSVSIAPFAKAYLECYEEVRKTKYKASNSNTEPFFLSVQKTIPKRLGGRSIENMVERYSKAYGKPTTPHKLRHTLATRLWEETKDNQLVATQLGHSGTEMVSLYTQITSDATRKSLDNL